MTYIEPADKVISIYKITCLVNDKIYIGRTSARLITRWRNHCAFSNMESQKNHPLYKEMNEYGIDNFKIEIIEVSKRLHGPWGGKLEKFWMYKLNTIYPNGYNIQSISSYYMPYIKGRIYREKLKTTNNNGVRPYQEPERTGQPAKTT